MNKSKLFFAILVLFIIVHKSPAQLSHPAGNELLFNFTVIEEGLSGVSLHFSSDHFQGQLLGKWNGSLHLPSFTSYIAIPRGATASVHFHSSRTETLENVHLADIFWLDQAVQLSEATQIRGVDVVVLKVMPFQYNPVRKSLCICRDIEIEITFNGGNGQFGENRLRSRWWDPVLKKSLLNYGSLPELSYQYLSTSKQQDYEYLVISPNNPHYLAWADSIKNFRNLQGIHTGVVTLTDIGGNSVSDIENYIDNAYHTWTIPPVAVLLLGDYETGPATGNGIISPVYNGYCVSDNIYADVDGNSLPDMAISRITARNAAELETMVNRILRYERTPPTSSSFYQNPLCVSGWGANGIFVLPTEVIEGFWENIAGKQPLRHYAGYTGGTPASWPTDPYSTNILAGFGPAGLGYVPATPTHLTTWSGNAASINSGINNGTFAVHYRGAGSASGWGEPSYLISDLSGLNTYEPPFILSLADLTGRFNSTNDCFAEAIYKHPNGALGVLAPSEISYAFVSDTYVWGIYDYLWPEFLPGTSSTILDQGIFPAFANVAGKYFLYQDNWPFNPNNKELTYHLFHHFGGSFSCLYTEQPQALTITHDSLLASGQTYFTVTADSGALIALTVGGEIIGLGTTTGNPADITIPPQVIGDTLCVTVTKTNSLRYSETVIVVDPALIINIENAAIKTVQLLQNYPNPFNPTTIISWLIPRPAQEGDGQLPVGCHVELYIYNLRGQKVASLIHQRLPAGLHSIEFDGSQLASGIYFYRLEAGAYINNRKMILLK